MKIAVISKSTAVGGGASRVAQSLTRLYAARGHDVTHWYAWGDKLGPRDRWLYGDNALLRRATKVARLYTGRAGLQEAVPLERLALPYKELLKADVIHLHDATLALSPWTIARLSRERPLLWTLHDMSATTGGCLTADPCSEYQRACRLCPQASSWPISGLFSAPSLQLLNRELALKPAPLSLAAPTRWMADRVASGRVFKQPVHVISNGVDLSVFAPRQKHEAKVVLGLEPARLTLLISAGNLNDERKGVADAVEACLRVGAHRPVQVLAMGKENLALAARFPESVPLRFTGYLTSPQLQAAVYSSADALVYCSYADNQPLTVIESLACGTPVFAYRTGGIAEMLEQGVHGGLAAPGDISALVEQLLAAELGAMGEAAAGHAIAQYDEHTMAEGYLSAFGGWVGKC